MVCNICDTGAGNFFVEPFQRAIIYFGGLWLMLGIYLTQALVVKVSKLLGSNRKPNRNVSITVILTLSLS